MIDLFYTIGLFIFVFLRPKIWFQICLPVQKLVLLETPVEEITGNVLGGAAATLKDIRIVKAPLQAIPTDTLAPLNQLEVKACILPL